MIDIIDFRWSGPYICTNLYTFLYLGMMLYEKQSSKVRLANLEFETDTSKTQELLKCLLSSMSLLQEAKQCIDLEPSSSPMAKYVHVINEDMKELSDYIQMVRELVWNL